MKVWLTCFILLFSAAELLQWVKQFSLPLPVFLLGGALLAVASNYDKLTHLPFHLDYEKPEALQEDASVVQDLSVAQTVSQKDGENLRSDRSRDGAISFIISKLHQPGD